MLLLTRKGAIGFIIACTATAQAPAAVVNSSWLSATNGGWDDAANWDSVNFPNNGVDTYNVTIDATGSAYTVTLNSAVTIDSLTLDSADANIRHSANVLSVQGNADLVSGTYTLDGGAINGGAWNQSGGTLEFAVNNSNRVSNGATVTGDLNFNIGSGRVIFESGATFSGDVDFNANNAILSINDTVTLDNKTINMTGSGSDFGVGGANTLTLGPNTLVTGRGNIASSLLVGGTGQINNQGTIRAGTTGQTLSVSPDILVNEATGTIEAINGGILNFGSTNSGDTATNLGSLNALNNSTLRVRGDWSNTSGTITIDATSNLEIEGAFTTADIGTLDNSAGGDVLLQAVWDNSGDSFTFNATTGSWILDSGSVSGGTLNEGGGGQGLRFGVSNSNRLNGGLNYVGDLTFDIASGRLVIEGGATFTGDANLTANNAFLIYNETTSIDNKTVNMDGSGGHLGVAGGNTLTFGPNLLVRGRGSIDSGSILGGTGHVNNQGTIRADLSGQTLTIDPDTFNNSGTVEATNNAILNIGSTGAGDSTTNSGNINALGGSTVRMRGDWSNTAGTITVDATSDLELEGGFTTADLGTVNNSVGGAVFVEGNWDNTADSFTFDATTGDWNLIGGSIAGGTINQGTLGEGLRFDVNNNNRLTDGLNYVGDLEFDIPSGRVIFESGASFTGDANLTASNAILVFNDTLTIDNKTINMDGSGAQFGVAGTNTLTLGPNTLVRGRGNVDSDTIISGNSQIINQGTIRADLSGQTLNIEPDTLNNSGTIEATNNALLNIGSTSAGHSTTSTGNINALGGSTVRMRGDWSNTAGTITVDATSSLELEGGFTTVDLGSIDNSAGGAVFVNGDWDNTADSFSFSATTGHWILEGGTIAGGTVNQGGGGQGLRFEVNNNNRITDGLNYVGDLEFDIPSGRVIFESGASFTGDANLTASSSILVFNDTLTIDNKTINMDGAAAQFGVGGTNTLTLGPNVLVRGRGHVDSDTLVSGSGQIINQGTIRADLSGQTLNIDPDILINQGTIEAINGGNLTVDGDVITNAGTASVVGGGRLILGNGTDSVTNTGQVAATDSRLDIGGNWTNTAGTITASNSDVFLGGGFSTSDIGTINRTGGTVNIAGDWDNASQSFTLDADTGDWLLNGGTITGGTINEGVLGEKLGFAVNNDNILTGGLVYNGDLNFGIPSGRLRIEGGVTFTGDVNMSATSSILVINDTQTLDNKVINLDAAAAQFGVGGDNTLTLGPGLLVRGRGRIDSDTIVAGNSTLINQGTIRADLGNQTLTIDPDTMDNPGTLEAINGGGVRLTTVLNNVVGTTLTGGTYRVADGGFFDFESGVINQNAAEIIIEDAGSTFLVEPSNTPLPDALTINTAAGALRILGDHAYAGSAAFTNAGDLELGGATFNPASIDNQATGEIFGFGTITPQVNTVGTVRASGGRLVLVSGLQGTGSTVVIEPGAILDFDGSDFIDTAATFSLTDGRLEGPGTIDIGTDLNQSGGTFAPGGSVGTTQLVGDYNLTGGTQETEFGGAGNPTDLLVATGDINIGAVGTLLDFRPVQGMAAGTYTLMQTTGGSVIGTFASVTDLGIYDDLVGVQYTATTVTFTLDRDLIFGDLNFDGFVGIADLNIVLGNWNQNVEPNLWGVGDPTGDGFVGIADLNAVLGSWNLGTPPTVAEAMAMVPEPNIACLMLAMSGLFLNRLSRNSHTI